MAVEERHAHERGAVDRVVPVDEERAFGGRDDPELLPGAVSMPRRCRSHPFLGVSGHVRQLKGA